MATRLGSHDVGASPDTSFVIAGAERSYKQQYANLYWLRLAALRARVLAEAKRRWSTLGEERPEAVPCVAVGTPERRCAAGRPRSYS